MSSVNIVHWKDMIGKENLEAFIKVQAAVMEKERLGTAPETIAKDVKKAVGDEIYTMWRRKREQMRYCGHFRDDEGGVRKTGWLDPVLDHSVLRFRFYAMREPDVVRYISLDAFHLDRREFEGEEEQRDVQGIVSATMRNDPDFIQEALC